MQNVTFEMNLQFMQSIIAFDANFHIDATFIYTCTITCTLVMCNKYELKLISSMFFITSTGTYLHVLQVTYKLYKAYACNGNILCT